MAAKKSETPKRAVPSESIADSQAEPGRWVKVAEAVKILGLSRSTVHRRVEAGTFRAYEVTRPQGTFIRLFLPASMEQRRAEVARDTAGISTEEPGSRVEKPDDNTLQAAVATLESLLFTGLDKERLLWLQNWHDRQRRAIDYLLAARRLVGDPEMPDALGR